MRKLAAIMFTDIVGYSALMSKDENTAMFILQKNREILKSAIQKYNGEFVKEIGDGTLSIFSSSLDAISCAVEIREIISGLSQWQLRIGIHIGDVVLSEGDVFGDGVNIASRIQMLCEPGGIFISGRVYDDIRNKSEYPAEYLGEKRLKNIDQPVQIYRIAEKISSAASPSSPPKKRFSRIIRSMKAWFIFLGLLMTLALVIFLIFKPQLINARQKVAVPIAVVSFENQTGDPNLDYLQKAIPNLIITNLEQSEQVRTMTWERMQDVLALEGKKEVGFIDSGLGMEICRKENFPYIVVGSIIKAGEVFMTDVKVLDVDTKQIVTSVSARGNGLASILDTQIDELSRAIIKSVGVTSRKLEESAFRVQDVTTNSLAAYDYFLKGREAYDKMYFTDAVPYLEQALKIDPGFSIANLYLSYSYSGLGMRREQAGALEKAFITSARATENERLTIQAAYAGTVQQDPLLQLSLLLQLAEKAPQDKRVFYAIGIWYRESNDPDKAIEYFEKAVGLDPNYGEAINQLAYRYFYKGDYAGALKCLHKYAELNPNDANPFDSMGDLFWQMGDLDRSLENFKHALGLKPDFFMSAAKITYIYAMKEDYEQVRYWMRKANEIAPNDQIRALMLWSSAFYDYLSGRPEQALKSLEKFSRIKSDETRLLEMAYNWLNSHISLDRGDYSQALKFNDMFLKYALFEPGDTPGEDSCGYFFMKGLCLVRQNDLDSARKCLEILKRYSKDQGKDFDFQYLQNEILIATARSVEELDNINALPGQIETFSLPGILTINVPFTRNSLAEAFARSGNFEKAIMEYERLITFDSTKADRYLINPLYHYHLGIHYENNGMKQKAEEQYVRFLAICKGADAQFTEYRDAEKRLTALVKKR